MESDPLFESDPVEVYIRELGEVPPLAPGEERELLGQVLARGEQAEAAQKRLVEANLKLVVELAQANEIPGVHTLDRIAEGNVALMRALDTFLGRPSDSFTEHARGCIAHAIQAMRP